MSDAATSRQDETTDAHASTEPGEGPDESTVQEIEEERERRLDPENRPENAEVDNTRRDFDVERGRFTDSAAYDESEPAAYGDPESDPEGDPQTELDSDTAEHTADETADERREEP